MKASPRGHVSQRGAEKASRKIKKQFLEVGFTSTATWLLSISHDSYVRAPSPWYLAPHGHCGRRGQYDRHGRLHVAGLSGGWAAIWFRDHDAVARRRRVRFLRCPVLWRTGGGIAEVGR